MFFIVGLGNPGEKFENTRHNVGFEVLDFFAIENNFPEFRFDKKSNSLISEKIFNNKKIFLIKPQTFMNSSGKSVKHLLDYYNFAKQNFKVLRAKQAGSYNFAKQNFKVLRAKQAGSYNKKGFFSYLIEKIVRKREKIIDNLIVIHDDLDIDIGKIKKILKRGAAGHNGVKSIIQELGTNNFIRIRVGIKKSVKNTDNKRKKENLANFVLSKFENEEKTLIEKSIKETSNQLKAMLLID